MKPYYRVYSTESTAAEDCGTLSEAQSRAEELAAKHPGRNFEILKCVGIASTQKASTFWMDGEEPPEKPRYRMLKHGETIEDGDQFHHASGEWRDHGYLIGDKIGNYTLPTRRPL